MAPSPSTSKVGITMDFGRSSHAARTGSRSSKSLVKPPDLYHCAMTVGFWRRKSACPYLIGMLTVAACLTLPARAGGQERVDPMAATVAQRFSMIEESFIALADAMPAEKYAFKPTNGAFKDVRTFGEQVKHVACTNFAIFNEIEKKEPPKFCGAGGPHPATTKAELMTYLRDSFTYADRVLRTMTPANALEPAGGPYGGMSTRLGLATLAVWHASDHYGQLVVYLRMNGVVPPESQPAPVKPTSALGVALFKDGGAYGTVTRVELPFGNLDTSFIESEIRSIGIASGDSFQVRCRDRAFAVLLGNAFGDVPAGEWVAFSSSEGILKIARNLANAAEASGCGAGDTLFVSRRPPVK